MRRLATLASAAVALAIAWPGMSGVANALVPPTGPPCHLISVPDALGGPDTYLGVLSGGPLVAAGTTMTLTCSVQVAGTGVHTDFNATTVSAGPAANAIALPPTNVTYNRITPDPVYVCTEVRQVHLGVAVDLYWDDPTQSWSLNPATAHCAAYPGVNGVPVSGGVVLWASAALTGPPQAIPFGTLADPNQWTCAVPAFSSSVPWSVTCTPVSSTIPWTCAITQAISSAITASAVIRTTLDCDGNSTPEVQNSTVTGPLNWDDDVTTPNVPATAFTCTADNGATSGPNADFLAYCEA